MATTNDADPGKTPSEPGDPAGYVVYADFVEKVLDAQEARKSSIEQRGLAVITTSGTLVTLLFGIVALATKRQPTYTLPADTQPWLIVAISAFVLAALLGLGTNFPMGYKNVLPSEIQDIAQQYWSEDAWSAEARVTRTRADIISSAARKNETKARILMAAAAVEALALIPLAIAISIILTHP